MKLTKVKSLIPAPKDGEGGITYEIVTNLSVLSADYDGHVQAHYLQPIAYATQDGTREMLPCSANSDWQIEYSIDGNIFVGCYNFNQRVGNRILSIYGIRGTEVATIQENICFRLVFDGDVMYEMAPIQVVKNGKRGPFYFPAGEFDPNTEYTRNENSAPYVSVVDTSVTPNVTYYYMLIADTNLVEGVYIAPGAQDASDIWELMTSNFKYLITEAIFSAFAKLGGFVVKGDFFISQYGKLKYNNNGTITTTDIDVSNYATLVGGRLPYTYLDENDPGAKTNPASGNYKFAPILYINAKTGKLAFTDGEFSGIINASTINGGNINGATINAGTINAANGVFTGCLATPYRPITSEFDNLSQGGCMAFMTEQAAYDGLLLPIWGSLEGVELDIINLTQESDCYINFPGADSGFYGNKCITSVHLGYKYARCKLKAVKIPGVDYIVWMVMDFGNIQLVKKTTQGNSYYYADAVMNNYREE